jgi:hypothetical protein
MLLLLYRFSLNWQNSAALQVQVYAHTMPGHPSSHPSIVGVDLNRLQILLCILHNPFMFVLKSCYVHSVVCYVHGLVFVLCVHVSNVKLY